jgi:signal peptidase II
MAERYEYPPTEFDPKPRRAGKPGHWFYFPLLLMLAAFVAVADHASKKFIFIRMPVGRTHDIIPGLLRLVDVVNYGAAFSFLADSDSPDTVRKGIMLMRTCRCLSPTCIALALILGGAIGNLYDRIVYHYVIDFIDVHLGPWHWPAFNFADTAIVIGACLLMLEIFRKQPENSADNS